MSPPVVLVAVDLDETADEVLATALRYAAPLGARIVLAHVVPEAALAFPEARTASAAHPAGLPQTPLLVQAARDRLDLLLRTCADAGVQAAEIVGRGDPAATVIDLVGVHGAELLVLGTHGRRGLSRVLMGSVAEAVLRRAPVPVLIVRTTTTSG